MELRRVSALNHVMVTFLKRYDSYVVVQYIRNESMDLFECALFRIHIFGCDFYCVVRVAKRRHYVRGGTFQMNLNLRSHWALASLWTAWLLRRRVRTRTSSSPLYKLQGE